MGGGDAGEHREGAQAKEDAYGVNDAVHDLLFAVVK